MVIVISALPKLQHLFVCVCSSGRLRRPLRMLAFEFGDLLTLNPDFVPGVLFLSSTTYKVQATNDEAVPWLLRVDKLHWFLRENDEVEYYGNFKWNKDSGIVLFAKGSCSGQPVCHLSRYADLLYLKNKKTSPYEAT